MMNDTELTDVQRSREAAFRRTECINVEAVNELLAATGRLRIAGFVDLRLERERERKREREEGGDRERGRSSSDPIAVVLPKFFGRIQSPMTGLRCGTVRSQVESLRTGSLFQLNAAAAQIRFAKDPERKVPPRRGNLLLAVLLRPAKFC